MDVAPFPGDRPGRLEARLEVLLPARVAEVAAIERLAYAHPWSERNFLDSLAAGYRGELLLAGDTLIGYLVAMRGVDEVHLLNITVAPRFQRQGWASLLLQSLELWTRGQGVPCLWLEARAGNVQALAVYEHRGFVRVGRRRDYYPAAAGAREDAVVMSKVLG